MDPISQAALGAGFAQSGARRSKLVPATIVGCLAGMAPDADIVIQSTTDPLLFLEYHRHFTHSLLFIPFGAAVCAGVFYWFTRRSLSWAECYLFCFLGYASHGVLDACTTYGTLLFWPLSSDRVAWDIVSVVDPAFTLPVIALTVLAYRRRRRWFAVGALGWACVYLGLGTIQHDRAMTVGAELARSRGHTALGARAMPSIANLLLWRHVYAHGGRLYVDAVRVGIETEVFEGSSLRSVDAAQLEWLDPSSTQAHDLERFAHFADGYLGIAADQPNRIVDLRYSALPSDVVGIWSIVLDPAAAPDAHVSFLTSRTAGEGGAGKLFRMLAGRAEVDQRFDHP